jgi:hypothetical protein
MDKIKKQYIYFLDNKDSLIKKYPGKILIISDNFEVFAFDSKEDAYTFDVKTFGFGNMLNQKCSESAISKVRKFHSKGNHAKGA